MLKALYVGALMIVGGSLIPMSQLHRSLQEKQKEEESCRCNFSEYKPLVLSHPLAKAAIKRVEPDYPLIAKQAKIQGKVEVRIVVDRNGHVVEVCIVKGHPMLNSAAKSAALQWKFKKNFGLSHRQARDYVEASLFFTFRLDD